MSEPTHVMDPDGHYRQIVSPRRLRELLEQDGQSLKRPTHLSDSDDWLVDDGEPE
jgi:hypothetical protein